MSATDIRIDGAWHFGLNEWSVTGDAMPIIPGDMNGGAGAMSFGIPEEANYRVVKGKEVVLRDDYAGTTSGRLGLTSGNGSNATLTGFSRIASLNVRRSAEPYSGSLRGAILYYMGLVGITEGISVSSAIASRTVNFTAWEGNVLDHMKDLCSSHLIEISLIGSTLVFRQARTRTLLLDSANEVAWAADESNLAQAVEVLWTHATAPTSTLLYPIGGWNKDVQVISVDAAAETVVDLPLTPQGETGEGRGMSAISLTQPTCVDRVDRYHTASSVYSVSGKDGLPIPPRQWTETGGHLSIEITDGGSNLRVTVKGSSLAEYGPYAIAMASGTSDTYSSLRVRGTGMAYTRSVIRMQTGLSEDQAPQEVAPRAESVFLDTYERAWNAAARLLSYHSGPQYTINSTLGVIDGYGSSGGFFGGDVVQEDVAAHPFGNVEGARCEHDGLIYRVTTATSTAENTTISATVDVTSADLAAHYGTLTAAQWNARFPAGVTAAEFNAAQLIGA